MFARFATAAAVLLPVAAARRAIGVRELKGGAVAGVLGALGFVLQAIGLRTASAGTSAFVTALGSLFAGLFAWPLLGQRPGRMLALGIAVAGLGAALLTGAAWTFGSAETLTALGAVAFGLQIVVLARVAPAANPLGLTAVVAASLALAAAPLGAARVFETPIGPGLLARFGYLVVAGSIVAPLLQIVAQRTVGAGRTGLLLGLEPVFAAIIAAGVGGEHPPGSWWAGAALILLAVWAVEWDASRASSAPPRPASAGSPR